MRSIKMLAVFGAGSLLLHSFFIASPAHAGFTRPIIFPVDGDNHFIDDFGDGRSGGRVHIGNDIIAKKLTPVLAVRDGMITFAPMVEPSYGYYLALEDSEGYTYHYLHLNNDNPGTDDGNGGPEHAYAPGIQRGAQVTAGQVIAWVGDSGNAETVGAHLHFEIHTPNGTPIDPYESLVAATKPHAPQQTVRIIPEGTLIKYPGDATVYLLADNVKYAIANEATAQAIGYSLSTVKTIPTSEAYRTGVPIELSPTIVFQRNGKPIATTSSTAYAPTEAITLDLRLGSKGPQVVILQSILKRLGFFTYPTITGYFGDATRTAVLKFQKAYGIEQVGNVGPKTRAALNAA